MSDERAQNAAIGWEKCERLLGNPDVQWFIGEAINKARAAKEAELKDLQTPMETRHIAAHVLAALEEAETFLPRQRDIYSRTMPKLSK